jgi:hypothetical protein
MTKKTISNKGKKEGRSLAALANGFLLDVQHVQDVYSITLVFGRLQGYDSALFTAPV